MVLEDMILTMKKKEMIIRLLLSGGLSKGNGAVLDMISSGALDLEPLISHKFEIEDANEAYNLITGSEASLGILKYPNSTDNPTPAQLSWIMTL